MAPLRAVRIDAPEADVLTVEEVRDHLNLGDSREKDEYIRTLIAAATDHIEGVDGIIGKALITQTWKMTLDGWPDYCPTDRLRLPLAPVQSITTLKYYDSDNEQVTLASDGYWSLYADNTSPYIGWLSGVTLPSVYGREDAIEVTFVAGYGDDPEDVPAGIKHAMKLLISQWFDNREVTGEVSTELPFAVTHLLSPKRAVFV